jgi:hypothetical protein
MQTTRYQPTDVESDDDETRRRKKLDDYIGWMDMAGKYQESRELKYKEDSNDWIDKGCYQFMVLLWQCWVWFVGISALIELSVQSPSQVAHDFLVNPDAPWLFNTNYGLTAWTSILTVTAFWAAIWFLAMSIKACSNRYAVKYAQSHPQAGITLPYPPLRMSVSWTFFILLMWASAASWSGRVWQLGTTINIIEQMVWFDNLMWFSIVSAVVTTLFYSVRIGRWFLDSALWCCGSKCFDC